MCRTIYVYRNEKWVVQGGPEDTGFNPDEGRSHYVINDSMDPLWHPAANKIMDSKSEFRKQTKAHNCIEYGNEPLKEGRNLAFGGLKQEVARSYYKVKYGSA